MRKGKRGRPPELVAELVRLKVDIIAVAGRNTLIQAAKTIPIVMTGTGSDPGRQSKNGTRGSLGIK